MPTMTELRRGEIKVREDINGDDEDSMSVSDDDEDEDRLMRKYDNSTAAHVRAEESATASSAAVQTRLKKRKRRTLVTGEVHFIAGQDLSFQWMDGPDSVMQVTAYDDAKGNETTFLTV